MRRLSQTGDTIVEVLLAIAVISAVLGGAFVSSRNSLNATQQAKERDQGVRLVESQVERLKVAGAGAFTVASPFCVRGDLTVQASACTLDSANNDHTAASQSIPYTVSVTRAGAGGNLTFTALATWDRAGGGQEQATLVYRTHQ